MSDDESGNDTGQGESGNDDDDFWKGVNSTPIIQDVGSIIRRASEVVKDRKPIDWIVEGVLPAGSFVTFAGPPKTGMKTVISMHLALCLARGEPFLGFATKKCDVWMLNLEDGYQMMANRLYAFGVRETDVDLDLSILTDEDNFSAAFALMCQKRPTVVIIDPLMELELLWGVTNENDAVQVAGVMKKIRLAAHKLGITILLIHHAGTKSDHRGSTALKGSTDGWLMVDWRRSKRARVLSWQPRGADRGEIDVGVVFTDDSVTVDCLSGPRWGDDIEDNGEDDDRSDEEGMNAEGYQKVCQVFQEAGGPLGKEDVRKMCKLRRGAVKAIMDQLESSGLLVKEGKKWRWSAKAAEMSDSFDPIPAD